MDLSQTQPVPPDVIDSFAEAMGDKKPSYRSGVHAYFSLPFEPGYALRLDSGALRNPSARDAFKYHTSLTPPEEVLLGPAVGQTFLQTAGGTAAILHMPLGHSLSYFFERALFGKNDSLSHLAQPEIQQRLLAASTKVMKELLAVGDSQNIETNPFVPLFEHAYELTHLGYQPDLNTKSLFYDRKTKTIGLFHDFSEDNSSHPTHTHALKLSLNTQCAHASSMFAAKGTLPAECDDYKQTLKAFQKTMEAAKNQVLKTHLGKDVPSSFAFANTHTVAAVELKKPSHVLLQRLREMDALQPSTAASK